MTWLTRRLKIQFSFGINSSLEALPEYKTSCLCGFRDKYLDLYMCLYGMAHNYNYLPLSKYGPQL